MTDLIARMEAFRSRLNPMQPYEEEHYITLTEAIAKLRSQDATVPRKVWLWMNFVDGRPEYWAFDNPYPCVVGGGDPLTLGEPCGYALIKDSDAGRPDVSEDEVIAAIKRVQSTHCACKFSSGGVPNQLCQWHLLFIEQQIAKSQEATVMECAEACDKIIAERTAIASRGDEGAAYEADWTRSIKAAILSRFGLKGENG